MMLEVLLFGGFPPLSYHISGLCWEHAWNVFNVIVYGPPQSVENGHHLISSLLSRLYRVSDDTIRRDLDALAELGVVQRVHGGALRRVVFSESFDERQAEGADAKDSIAQATMTLLHPGQVILLDGGTTSLAIVRHLPPDFTATIITTSPPIAMALAAYPSIDIILIGGRLYRYAMVAVGAETVARLRAIHADICILGIMALHPTQGLSVRDYEEAQAKRAMIAAAPHVVAPTIRDKLGMVAAFAVAPPSAITHLVTETTVTADELISYREVGMTILQA